ncbi:hypothetical protein [Parvularcula sp. LCG005]|uniref:hypothetical protein n=1 Tax=Parvularcula sp. LCG005 TaxID=3078805 RepID=UPI002943AA9C|nr:hypothetical protein [Parvularcula sp. LCG005]WOI54302.1 hypothetical protein RUI03_04700 [Parvularcula sp. LCG005]
MKTDLSLRPYWAGDWRAVRPRAELQVFSDLTIHHGLLDRAPSPDMVRARTLCRNGRPIASAGLFLQRAHLAEAWAMFAEPDPRATRMVVTAIREQLAEAVRDWSLTRIEASCLADFPAGQRFLTFLGFAPYAEARRRAGPHTEILMEYLP